MSRKARACALFACLLVLSVSGAAQTVRPVIAELGNPAKGRVEYVNDSNTTLNVIIEPKSFSVDERGEVTYGPLDPKIKLKLSATSFRLSPHQSYYLFYEAGASESPSWFVLYAAFSGFARTDEGLNVRLELPHTVYLLPKKGLAKADISVTKAEYDRAGRKVTVVVENSGPNFGRAMETAVVGTKKQDGPGFPIFPKSRRVFEVPWERDGDPQTVQLDFDKFKVEAKVVPTS